MNKIVTLISCLTDVIEKKKLKQLQIIIHAILTMRGRITMKGLSRWSEKGGSYSTINRFFHSEIDWLTINWLLIKDKLITLGIFLLVGDEVVITKDGKETFGVDRFFSSIQNQVVPSISFLTVSIVSVSLRKAFTMLNVQIVKENKEGCIKDKSKCAKNKKSAKKSKRTPGRPKGSKNKNSKDKVKLSPYHLLVKESILKVLCKINKFIPIAYFVFDGAFGNHNAAQMVLQTGLHLISKLRFDSALYFQFEGEQKGRGRKKKYGKKIDYKNIQEKYLKETTNENGIETNIFQMNMWHKKFVNLLNIVVIVKRDIEKKRVAHTVLFCTNLDLDYKKIVDYYSLRFQIEFVFRDAKQHWGMEDFMNVNKIAVNNFTNLSTFMVNFSYPIRKELGDKEMSIIDLKAHFHGLKYANEALKLLPKITDVILLNKLYDKITTIGAIKEKKDVA